MLLITMNSYFILDTRTENVVKHFFSSIDYLGLKNKEPAGYGPPKASDFNPKSSRLGARSGATGWAIIFTILVLWGPTTFS